MTREIAVEWARRGIRCNALCPGPVDTPMFGDYVANVPTLHADDVARAVGWIEELPSHVVLREIVLEPVTSGPFVPSRSAREKNQPEGPSDG